MARDPFRFETNLDYSRPLSAPTVEPFLQTVQPRIDDFQAPKHALINSLRMQIRQANEEKLRRWNESVDEPAIIKSIADNRREADERNKRFDSILARYENPDVPLEETTPLANLGEAISGAAGMLMGDRNAPNEVAKLASARQKAVFARRMARFGMKRQADQTALERVSRDIDYYRALAETGQQDLKRVKAGRADLIAQGIDQESQVSANLSMTELNDLYQQAKEHRDQIWQEKFQGLQFDQQKQLQAIRTQDSMKAAEIESILKGLESLEEDPKSTDPSQVDGAIASLREKGFNLPDSAIGLYKEKAHNNFDERQWKHWVMQSEMNARRFNQTIQQRNQALDEQRFGFLPGSLGKGPGGGFLSVTPQGAVFNGWDTGRPDAGKGEADFTKLIEKLGTHQQTVAELNDPDHDDTKDAELKAAKNRLEGDIGRHRQAIIAQASPAMKDWLVSIYEYALGEIANVKAPDGEVGVPGVATVNVGKQAKDAIRKRFKDTTGFDIDDPKLKQLAKAAAAAPVLPGGPTGAIGK